MAEVRFGYRGEQYKDAVLKALRNRFVKSEKDLQDYDVERRCTFTLNEKLITQSNREGDKEGLKTYHMAPMEEHKCHVVFTDKKGMRLSWTYFELWKMFKLGPEVE